MHVPEIKVIQILSLSTFSNIFSETTGPLKVKLRVKFYSNGPGYMTKMAAKPIYDKNL